jgi:hypothetical protein
MNRAACRLGNGSLDRVADDHSKLGVGTSNERAHHRVRTKRSLSPNLQRRLT